MIAAAWRASYVAERARGFSTSPWITTSTRIGASVSSYFCAAVLGSSSSRQEDNPKNFKRFLLSQALGGTRLLVALRAGGFLAFLDP